MHIQKFFSQSVLVGFSVLGLAACSSVDKDRTAYDDTYEIENIEQTNAAVYVCNGIPLNIYFHAEQAQLSWKEKTYRLTHAVSASGAFYLGEGVSFWIHDDSAELEFNDMEKDHCRLVRVES